MAAGYERLTDAFSAAQRRADKEQRPIEVREAPHAKRFGYVAALKGVGAYGKGRVIRTIYPNA